MAMQRCVLDEILDGLAEADPRAQRSRADLRRINRIMGTRTIMLDALARLQRPPRRVIEFGAGDGTLMLRLAARLAPRWPAVELTLLDRLRLVDARTVDGFRALGWQVEIEQADLLDWLARPPQRYDLGLANLFLHHFEGPRLARALQGIAACCDAFLACEPRRARLALAASRLVGFIGANAVTREDAVKSVHAGFAGQELSALWPPAPQWRMEESAAGLFSHRFFAVSETGKGGSRG